MLPDRAAGRLLRPTLATGALLLGLVVSSCSGPSGAPTGADQPTVATPPAAPPPGLSVTVLQYSHDAVKKVLAVQVHNGSSDRFTVTSLEVVAPGFDGVGQVAFDTPFEPGRALDLRVPYGAPDCDAVADPDALRIRLGFAGGAEPVAVAPAEGGELLARIHDQVCAADAALAAMPVEWTSDWRIRGSGQQASAYGTLRVGPVAPGRTGEVVEGLPTTLFQLFPESAGRPFGPGESAEVDVEITPTRCDPHAIGESPQGFEFYLRVRLTGPDQDALVLVPPDQEARDLLQDYLLDRCGLR